VRNEEIHNLLSTHIMIVLVRAVTREKEICDVCSNCRRLENFRNDG